MRFEQNPADDSIDMRQAAAAPYPFLMEGSKFFERMAPDIRRETQCALEARMRTWNRALENIELLLVNEILYRFNPEGGFQVTIRSFEDIKQDQKLHWLVQQRNLFELDPTLEIRFPTSATSSNFDDFQPVPPKKARPANEKDFTAQSYRLATAGEDNNVRVRISARFRAGFSS